MKRLQFIPLLIGVSCSAAYAADNSNRIIGDGSAKGPLHVHPADPRYFSDGTTNAGGSLRGVYLGGHQIYDHPFEQPQHEMPAWQLVRANIRQTRVLSARVQDMARMHPRPDLASTGYCLPSPGEEYVVFAPRQEEIHVRELQVGRRYQGEWFCAAKASPERIPQTTADSSTLTLQVPCAEAVLFLEQERQPTRRPGP